MNSFDAPRVSLVCRLVRTWSGYASQAPENRSASGVAARHVAGCADCRHYFAAADQLDRDLRRDSRRAAHAMPAGLEARICRALEPTQPRAYSRSVRPRWVWMALAASSLAAAVIVIQLRQPNIAVNDHAVPANEVAKQATPKKDLSVPVDPLPVPVWRSLVPSVATLREENPLQRELAAVESDTRSALRFLARNFLPNNAEPQASPGGSRGSSS